MSDSLFLKIVAGEIPADIVHETDNVLAFRDVNPQASTHVLVIPKRRIPTVNDLTEEDAPVIGEMFLVAKAVAAAEGLADDGYRLVMNCNEHGGQTVFHIHLHLIGGRPLGWPPG
ncbi:MAG: histidine triad nucleotide-binding protein [Pseudomonadota bacterium]